MNEIITRKDIKIEDMIFEIRGKQVMLDSEISRTKCKNYLYYKMKYTMILESQYQYLMII